MGLGWRSFNPVPIYLEEEEGMPSDVSYIQISLLDLSGNSNLGRAGLGDLLSVKEKIMTLHTRTPIYIDRYQTVEMNWNSTALK